MTQTRGTWPQLSDNTIKKVQRETTKRVKTRILKPKQYPRPKKGGSF